MSLASNTKKLGFWDIGLIKAAAFFFALFIASLWPAILSLEWYWYLAIALIAAIKPMMDYWG